MEKKHTRGSFTGSIGFVLAAAGSAVGLGNIWRFPYLAAKDGGGTFILVYIVLALTFGFTLLPRMVTLPAILPVHGSRLCGWESIFFLPHSLYIVVSIRELKTTAKF